MCSLTNQHSSSKFWSSSLFLEIMGLQASCWQKGGTCPSCKQARSYWASFGFAANRKGVIATALLSSQSRGLVISHVGSEAPLRSSNVVVKSWRTNVSFFPSFLKKKGKSREELKVELLETIAPLDRGVDATLKDQEWVDQEKNDSYSNGDELKENLMKGQQPPKDIEESVD